MACIINPACVRSPMGFAYDTATAVSTPGTGTACGHASTATL
ncbi:hypothetical protein PF003_g33861 [Phytophthora fragariae]|nr:hypothetical protein PF003_g33861 [Phytophthora fragariae]